VPNGDIDYNSPEERRKRQKTLIFVVIVVGVLLYAFG